MRVRLGVISGAGRMSMGLVRRPQNFSQIRVRELRAWQQTPLDSLELWRGWWVSQGKWWR